MSTGKYQSVKLNHENAVSLLDTCGCTFMWSKDKFNTEYVNSRKTKMEYKGCCGHTWSGNWSSVQRRIKKQVETQNMNCPPCSSVKFKWNEYDKEHYNEETDEYLCSQCNEWKDLKTNFSKAGRGTKNGRRNYCQKCGTAQGKKMRLNWTEDEFIHKYLIINAKKRHIAKLKNGIKYEEFNITYKDVVELKEKQNNKCKYTGVDLVWKVGSSYYQTSIDRIDSNKTYTKDNIQLVCFWANMAKSDLCEKEFIEMIKNVYNYSCKK